MLQVDQARVKDCLHYDPETGIFTRKKRTSNRTKIGAVAGSLTGKNSYLRIRLDGHPFYAHRLAWLYVYGVTPPAQIDHINGVKTDNRIANLRLATRVENARNSRGKPSVSKLKGAHWKAERKVWLSTIRKDGKNLFLGHFATAEEAHAAYVKAAHEHFGEFARSS